MVLVVVWAVHLAAQLGGVAALAGFSQVLVMPALAAVLWTSTSSPREPLVRLALGALGLSWLGDSVPRLAPESLSFLVMVVFFLGAQVVYALGFWPYRHRSLLTRPVRATPYLFVAAVTVLVCAPSAGELLPAITVYSAAIATMAVLATGLGRLGAVGGAVFVVSDSLIALDAFGVLTLPAQGFWVMSTYLLAQLLLMFAVRREDRRS
ncbi:hypothetical protein BH708_07435 [Brachybacterium sp. P6-10-X1]|uniref:lysoplasmalogenase n=1 Tax=Brachybacterium sp. P6-10-X1 TaxID=1903186 RepID=UPI00097190C0|nr:lysoplasmalogenase [Brachybacterium sp. P6-10-X1]APX32578.1 hypothetical protein BH708_07435 [Brachybacterium sp. P6-10-X1]